MIRNAYSRLGMVIAVFTEIGMHEDEFSTSRSWEDHKALCDLLQKVAPNTSIVSKESLSHINHMSRIRGLTERLQLGI